MNRIITIRKKYIQLYNRYSRTTRTTKPNNLENEIHKFLLKYS